MPCSCSKKTPVGQDMNVADPLQWGPILWKYLHSLAENLGFSNNVIVDTDQANYMETILSTLHLIIPCQECQGHTLNYVSLHPIPVMKGLRGDNLRAVIRDWLFHFHNSVRAMKGQPIIFNTPDECSIYKTNVISKSEYAVFIQSVGFASRQGWVRVDNWRKWYSNSERLRIIAGNIVV